AYLLIYGELPNKAQFDEFEKKIKAHQLLHESKKKILAGFPEQSHPMGILSSLATTLTAFFPESLDPHRSAEGINLTITRLLAKIPPMVAWTYTYKLGLRENYPDSSMGYVENFLKMMFAVPSEDYEVDPVF